MKKNVERDVFHFICMAAGAKGSLADALFHAPALRQDSASLLALSLSKDPPVPLSYVLFHPTKACNPFRHVISGAQ